MSDELIEGVTGIGGADTWREAAVDAMLKAEAAGSVSLNALLRKIRQHRPGSCSLLLYPDRLQLLRFLKERTGGGRSLLSGDMGHIERDEVCPYIGWYETIWEGMSVEIILLPSLGLYSWSVYLAAEGKALRRFADALEEYARRPVGRCLRYAEGWENSPELDAEIGKVTWDDVVLPSSLMIGVRDAVEGFFHHKEAFDTLGFPWRRGLLLVGPPGTGKTMICKAAAAAVPELPFLYVRDFQVEQHCDHQDAMRTIFERARQLAPCLLAFEDIDGLVTEGNRTVFLNEMDGFQNNNGLLIIASSNHPERIDEALLKRPSRFDRVFHVGLPALPERRTYCERLLARSTLATRLAASLDVSALAQQVAECSDGFTPAYLKEAFVAAALRQAQEGADVLDERFAEAVLAQVQELRDHLRRVQNPDALGEFLSPESAPVGIRRNRF